MRRSVVEVEQDFKRRRWAISGPDLAGGVIRFSKDWCLDGGLTNMPARWTRASPQPVATMRDYTQPDVYTRENDPLGLSSMARGRQRRMDYAMQHPGYNFGPLPDPQWEGYFDRLNQAGVSGLRGGESPEGSNQIRGTSSQPVTQSDFTSTLFAPGQKSAHGYTYEDLLDKGLMDAYARRSTGFRR